MTNLDKAKELIHSNKFEIVKELDGKKVVNMLVHTQTAFKAINLAAQVDWKYPAKGEFPNTTRDIILVTLDNKTVCGYYKIPAFYYSDGELIGDKNEVIAWCELPKYEPEK